VQFFINYDSKLDYALNISYRVQLSSSVHGKVPPTIRISRSISLFRCVIQRVASDARREKVVVVSGKYINIYKE